MSNSQELMLKSLTKYFKSNLENEKTFVNIITGKYRWGNEVRAGERLS